MCVSGEREAREGDVSEIGTSVGGCRMQSAELGWGGVAEEWETSVNGPGLELRFL